MNWHLLLLISSAWALSPSEEWKERIINGSDAKRHQFPYIVSINNGRHQCGGSILSHTWVISAGHCFENKDDSFTAIAGLLNQNETHSDIQKIPIVKIVVHPEYIRIDREYILQNDIAVLNLAQPLVFSKAVQPVKLPHPDRVFYGKAWLAGWGSYTIPETLPVTLQCLEMNIITNNKCHDARMTLPGYELLDQMICTTPLSTNYHSTACHGDSGGPLVQNGILIGIASFVVDAFCSTDVEVPTNVFTRVSSFLEFINIHVKDI